MLTGCPLPSSSNIELVLSSLKFKVVTLERTLLISLRRFSRGFIYLIREGTMKFTYISQIRCFTHILNLVIKTILRSLRASSRKEAYDLLDNGRLCFESSVIYSSLLRNDEYNFAESDIDKYFDTPTIRTSFDWKANMLEFSYHLALPAAEVDIERLFNGESGMLGIRRFSMKGKTLRTLLRLEDAARWKSS
ncbi:HAT dimerization [Penicillium viridicatum]|nr:HAT dimerization [Penicillium viridicatum]